MHHEERHVQHIPKAVAYAVLSAIAFSAMSVIVKIIGDRASTDAILFSRYLVSMIAILPWVLKNPMEALKCREPLKLISRSAVSLLALGSFFYALRSLPLGNALVLNNTFPLFIPLVAWAVHKIWTPHKMWIGIGLGFIGVLVVLRPDPRLFQMGSAYALASGVLAAVAFIMVRFMTKSVPVIQILFYNFLISGLITAALLPFGWIPPSREVVYWLLGVGIFGVGYQCFSTMALAKGSARMTSPLMYLTIVFGVIADFFLWNMVPDAWSIFGMICVIAGGVLTIFFGQREMK